MQVLDSYTITSGILTLLAAVGSAILSIADQGDKRKKFWGLSLKKLKRFSVYSTLSLAILTIILDTNHKIDEKIDAIQREKTIQAKEDSLRRIEDSTQRENLNITLAAINKTLDSTDKVLVNQQVTLKTEIEILQKQKIQIDKNTELLTGQEEAMTSLSNILFDTDPIYGSQFSAEFTSNYSELNSNIKNFPHFTDKICSDIKNGKLKYKKSGDYLYIQTNQSNFFNGYVPITDIGIYIYSSALDTTAIQNEFKRLEKIELFKTPYDGQTYMGTILEPTNWFSHYGFDSTANFSVICSNEMSKSGINASVVSKLEGMSHEKKKTSFSGLSKKLCVIAVTYRELDLEPWIFRVSSGNHQKSVNIKPIKVLVDNFYSNYGQERQIVYLCKFEDVSFFTN